MSEVACPSCGAVNPTANRFCGACGASLEVTCGTCGAANPPGNRFCGSCGRSVDSVPPWAESVETEERKVVSMLFADLTASTEMASRLDPEDLRAVLRPFFDAMTVEIERFGGTVEKFIGDAVVAAFGAPVSHEDDPERAIRCALGMQRRLTELNEELAERAGADLAMRIGINTGDVIAHGLDEGIVTGEAVNIAARFQALAEPGRVVVGERTYLRAAHAFGFTDRGEVTVKGIERPLRVYEVGEELVRAGGTDGMPVAPFVGRGPEVELLRLLFERTVREGRPNLVTIAGPPGIGKSRLSREVARALADDARVVRGRCLPYGDGLTYWPLAEILKTDAGILDSDEPDTIRDKALARLDPRFPGDEGIGLTAVLLSSIGVEVASDPLAGSEPGAAARVIANAWLRYFESMASQGPFLALIEDIHWADPSLLELIESSAARMRGPGLIMCMARPDLSEQRPNWGGGLTNATTISLSPLTAADGTELIQHLLDGGAPADVVDAILRRSEGNPFYTGELLRMMIEDGTIARLDGRWGLTRELPADLPDTVQGVIASRLDMLTPHEKRAIQDASVVGRIFWRGAIERLGVAGADGAIEALIAKGFVREGGASTIAGERELIFNHILTRDVAYASIPRARRAETHGRVGLWAEEVTRGRDEEFAEILAYHFGLAGDPERSARYALLAGNRHGRVFAADRAIEWYGRALSVASTDDAEMRSRICLARGGALELIGRFPEALASYEDSLAEARRAGRLGSEARALAAKAHVLWLLDRYDEAQALLPVALDGARKAELPDVEARLLYTAGTIRFGRGEFTEALPLHEQALGVATASDDLEGQALAHHGLCETYFFVWPMETGLEHGRIADRMLRELGQRSMVAHNAYMVAWSLGFLGRWDEAKDTVDASIETLNEVGNPRDEAFALATRAKLLLSAGRLDDAWNDGRRGRELFRELGLPRGEIVGSTVLGEVLAEAGDLEGLSENARAALTISDALGSDFHREIVLAFVGWAELASGDQEAAERAFARARSASTALGVAWPGSVELLAREWAGDAAGLRSIAERFEQLVIPHGTAWSAWAPYGRALADLLDGDAAASHAKAGSAIELAHAATERRIEWRAGRVAWLALEALGRTDEAERHREAAADIVRDFAAQTSGGLRSSFLARPEVAELLA